VKAQIAPDVHNLLVEASQCLAADQTTKAKKLGEQAVARAPASADAHMVLADVLAARSEVEAARTHYRKATECEHYHFGAWINWGVFSKENEEYNNAVKCFKNASMIDPKSSLARYNLARSLLSAKEYRESAEQFQIFSKMEPGFADGHYSLGITQDLAGEYDDAIGSLEKALKIDPDLARAQFAVGFIHQTLGKFDVAERYFKKAIELEPKYGKSYMALAVANSYKEEDSEEVLAVVQEELNNPELHPGTRIGFLSTAFRILDRAGRYDEAYVHLAEYNSMKDAAVKDFYDEQVGIWERLKSTYTKEFFEKHEARGDPTTQPVFIVGMPRSGTTLTEQIIASHPKAFGAGELLAATKELTDLTQEKDGDIESYPRIVTELSDAELKSLAQRYLGHYPEEAAPFERVTDKLPDNYMHLGTLRLCFPNAKFVWCRRNPIDTCLSCFIQTFSAGLWYTFDQKKVARRYRDHVDLMEHWKAEVPGQIYEVDYDALTRDPEPNIRKLIEFCGLEWDDACLNFHETERAVRTASVWQVRQPIYTTSVERWRNYEKHLGPMIEELGDLAEV
jgi:tetratricopeptide (TPR) repeat protein